MALSSPKEQGKERKEEDQKGDDCKEKTVGERKMDCLGGEEARCEVSTSKVLREANAPCYMGGN